MDADKSLVEAMDNDWAGMPDDTKNTEAEATAVDEGVQEALAAPTARWHRREARKSLIGRSGLSNEEKVAQMKKAIAHLNAAVHLIETGEIVEPLNPVGKEV